MATYNAAVIWLCFAVFFGALILIVNFISRLRKGKKKKTGRSESTEVIRDDNDRAIRNRGRGARGRMIARRDEEDDDGFYEDEDEEDFGMSEKLPKMGAKKRLKMEMKAEKRAMREEMEAEREERKQREAAREAERKREEKRREAEQQVQEEEERLRKEEQERREHEEYLKLKEMFSIDEEGTGETEEESQALLQEFVDYIKTSKVVLLEDLACHFGLRTPDAINRLQNLQEMGRVTGVTDDRGKFIYISEEELASVARFIKQRGRVTITELAECSNSLINLKPSVIDKSRQMEISA